MSEGNGRAAVFDLGNTLLFFDVGKAARRLSERAKVPAGKIEEVLHRSPLAFRFEEGKIPPEGFFRQAALECGFQWTWEEFLPVWNEIFTENRPVVEIFLSTPRPRYILSNTNLLHIAYCREKFPWLKEETFLGSPQLGVRKPAPAAYQEAQRRIGLSGPAIFYTDDRPENIEGARTAGWFAHRYETPEGLEDALREWR